MQETDLSEGFGFKPGSLSEIKSRVEDEDLKPDVESVDSNYSQNFCELEDDFQTLKQVLKSKYDAIEILKRISQNMNIERIGLENHLMEISILFKNEIMKLEEELEETKTTFYDNLKIWTARFKELDRECCKLKEELLKKSNCIQNLTADNINLLKEKEQLLLLLSKYENSKITDSSSPSKIKPRKLSKTENSIKSYSFDNYQSILKSSNLHSKFKCEEPQTENSKTDETYIMVEAYRMAFEELLAKNRELTLKFSQIDRKGLLNGKINHG